MSFVSIRRWKPIIGKSALLAERSSTIAGIYGRHGARVRVAKAVSGDGAGETFVAATFADGASLAAVWAKVQADPMTAKLAAERELEPAVAAASGPEVYRMVFGEVQAQPVILMREYRVSRDKRDGILAMMPELDALMRPHDVRLLVMAPVFSSDMERLVAVYYHKSVEHLGESLDGVGVSAEFQAIVTKASEHGTLVRSRVLVSM